MSNNDLKIRLNALRSFPNETEWVDFKMNNSTEIEEHIFSFIQIRLVFITKILDISFLGLMIKNTE